MSKSWSIRQTKLFLHFPHLPIENFLINLVQRRMEFQWIASPNFYCFRANHNRLKCLRNVSMLQVKILILISILATDVSTNKTRITESGTNSTTNKLIKTKRFCSNSKREIMIIKNHLTFLFPLNRNFFFHILYQKLKNICFRSKFPPWRYFNVLGIAGLVP